MAGPEHPRLLLPPPVYPAVLLAAAWGLDRLVGWSFLPEAAILWPIGATLIAAGFGFAVWAVITFMRAGTHVEPHKPTLSLVTTGPYRWSRNPIYFSFLLIFVGAALTLRLEWALVLLAVLWACLRHLVIAPEERFLEARFGASYVAFRSKTARWIQFTPSRALP